VDFASLATVSPLGSFPAAFLVQSGHGKYEWLKSPRGWVKEGDIVREAVVFRRGAFWW